MQQKPFVLLVEDDALLRKVIAANLDMRGYIVLEADSFQQAVDRLSIKPRLMILDIRLPDGSGWDVVQWARTVSASAPTILMSAFEPDRQKMQRFTPVGFLHKPFAIKQMLELVERYAPSEAHTSPNIPE